MPRYDGLQGAEERRALLRHIKSKHAPTIQLVGHSPVTPLVDAASLSWATGDSDVFSTTEMRDCPLFF